MTDAARPIQDGADARRLTVRRKAWARGALEARQLDLKRARAQTPAERIEEGLALVRIADALQSGRRATR